MTLLAIYLIYAIALSMALARKGFRAGTGGTYLSPGKKNSRLLIIGATGGTGRQLVAQALDLGHEVTAFVRNRSALNLDNPNLRVVEGDVMDYDSVAAAAANQDAVLSALGHKRYFYPTRILSEGTRNIIKAMENHGVRRLICETSLGIGSSSGRMGIYYTFFVIPLILPFYFWDKARQGQIIAESELDWVIVRPGALTNSKPKGRYRQGQQVGNFFWTVKISRADVAEFMLKQLEDNSYQKTSVGLSN